MKRVTVGFLALALMLTLMPVLTPARSSALAASYIGSAKAQQIALKNAGTTKDKVTNLKTTFDREDREYEVRFRKSGYNFDYAINAKTGRIEEKEYKIVKIDKKSGKEIITKAKAKSMALSKVGAKASTKARVTKQAYRGTKVWKVEFNKGRHEYEYKINVYSGKILEMDYEYDD